MSAEANEAGRSRRIGWAGWLGASLVVLLALGAWKPDLQPSQSQTASTARAAFAENTRAVASVTLDVREWLPGRPVAQRRAVADMVISNLARQDIEAITVICRFMNGTGVPVATLSHQLQGAVKARSQRRTDLDFGLRPTDGVTAECTVVTARFVP